MTEKDEYLTSPYDLVRDQIETVLATGTTASIDMKGKPVVLITMRGAKSGRPRLTPLIRVEHEGAYAVVASKGGSAKHPIWYHNLKAHPLVKIQDGTEIRSYVARELTGDERELWWPRAVEAFPDFAVYQTRTDRELPIFVFERA